MSSRKVRNLILVALVAGVAYWIYKDRPTVSGLVDTITDPLLGSRAAVKSSERNRVVGDASAAISEQTELPVGSLREGMTSREVVELLGDPDSKENEVVDGVKSVKWTYGGGAKTWPGGGASGGVAGAGHLALTMKGASGGAVGGTGVCGRPTSAVVQEPTQRSARPLCANVSRTLHRRTNASASRSVVDLIALLLVPHAGCVAGFRA